MISFIVMFMIVYIVDYRRSVHQWYFVCVCMCVCVGVRACVCVCMGVPDGSTFTG